MRLHSIRQVLGRIRLYGRLTLTLGTGHQFAVSHAHPQYENNWIFSVRTNFDRGEQESHGETGFGLVYPSLRILRKLTRSASCWELSWRLPICPLDSIAEVAWAGVTPETFCTFSRTSGGGNSGL